MATANDDFEYYTKINQLQEFLKEREVRRMELDQQFHTYMRSDGKRSSNRAAQLQAYWKKLCQNERASQARNQGLLREFDRVEAHVASLSVRTERLRLVQDQYKRQVDQRYPNWRQRYMEQLIKQRMQHTPAQPESHLSHAEHESGRRRQAPPQTHPHRDRMLPNSRSHDQLSPPPMSRNRGVSSPTYHGPRETTRAYDKDNLNVDRTSETSSSRPSMDRSLEDLVGSEPTLDRSTGDQGSSRHHIDTSSQELAPSRLAMSSEELVPSRLEAEGRSGRIPLDRLPIDRSPRGRAPNRTLVESSQESTQSDLPHAASDTFVVAEPEEPQEWASQEDQSDHQPSMSPILTGIVAHRQIFGSSPTPGRTQTGDASSRTDPFSSASGEESQEEENEEMEDSQVHSAPGHSRGETVTVPESEDKAVDKIPGDDAVKTGNEDGNSPTRNVPTTGVSVEEDGPPTKGGDRGSPRPDEVSDIESDLSLPLSEDQQQSSPEQESVIPPGPELTTDGYLHLLQGLEYIIERSEGRAEIYDDSTCSREEETSIARDANSKLPMDTYDAHNLSRVVLQELPLLIQATPRGYLISDQVLKSERPVLEVTIRSAITTNALPFWDRTLKHMVFLIRRGYFEPDEIALQVAPLMLAKGSPMGEKAVKVVTNLLEYAVEEPTLEESSITHTSVGETPPAPQQENKAGRESVPPLELDMSGEVGGSSEDEANFFDQDVPLKETDAYKQMLQSMQPKSGRQTGDREGVSKDTEGLLAELDESSSSDDGIDALVSPPATGRSSDGKPKRTVLSSLGGVLDQVGAAPAAPDVGGAQIDTPSPDKSDAISSASETPQDGGGYVPSALDNSLKSSGRRSNALQRSSSFWGEESDLDESEMSVPMGTGAVDDDKDDFDFYD